MPGDVLVHLEARVSQGDDLVNAQRLQLVHLNLECLHFIGEIQVWPLENRKKKKTQDGLRDVDIDTCL